MDISLNFNHSMYPQIEHNEYWTMHVITKDAQSHKVIKQGNQFWTNKISDCIYKITRVQLFIIDEALSSTLDEGLASHDHKRHVKIKWNHEKQTLTIEKMFTKA
jgi:hypothetical protein